MEKRLINYKDLTRSEKIDHIWEYYKFPIIGTILGLLVIYSGLNHYVINPPPEVTLDVSIFGDYAQAEIQEELEASLQSIIVKEGENEETLVDFFSVKENQDYNIQQATVTKMIGKATLHEFDIMIFVGDYFQNFLQEETLLALNDMIDSGVIKIDESQLRKGSDFDYASDEFYLIDISDHEGFQRLLNTDKPIYLGVFAASKHMEHIEESIDYILNGFK